MRTRRDAPDDLISLFDLVLLDNWMSDMSGIEVCHKIRESNPDFAESCSIPVRRI
jgi:CheY-like chemotaxis protein